MPQDKDRIRLQHMLDHATEAMRMAFGRARADLDRGRQLDLSLVRLLEIVGEAAARVSESTRRIHPDIAWLEIAGLRNRLIHGYNEVDSDILWDIIQLDLPPLCFSNPLGSEFTRQTKYSQERQNFTIDGQYLNRSIPYPA
jgi:uncharacterized protein with HEPN domain